MSRLNFIAILTEYLDKGVMPLLLDPTLYSGNLQDFNSLSESGHWPRFSVKESLSPGDT